MTDFEIACSRYYYHVVEPMNQVRQVEKALIDCGHTFAEIILNDSDQFVLHKDEITEIPRFRKVLFVGKDVVYKEMNGEYARYFVKNIDEIKEQLASFMIYSIECDIKEEETKEY